jgi:hypothetical protein
MDGVSYQEREREQRRRHFRRPRAGRKRRCKRCGLVLVSQCGRVSLPACPGGCGEARALLSGGGGGEVPRWA